MEEISKLIEKITRPDSSNQNKHINLLYKKISEYKPIDKHDTGCLFEYILPKIYDLYQKDIIKRDVLYLSLIGAHNVDVLQIFLKYHEATLNVNLENATRLYDYCVCKKKHWFNEILTTDNIFITNQKILNKILTLQIIGITNSNKFDTQHVKRLLENIDKKDIHPFWKKYFIVTEYFLKIMDYVKTNISSLNAHDIFCHINENAALETFSNYLPLKSSNLEQARQLIIQEENIFEIKNHHSTQFEAFIILRNLFNCITRIPNINISDEVNDIKERLLNIADFALQLELLEIIFVTIFLEKNHLSNKVDDCKMVCEEKEVRLLLFLVKEVLDEVKLNNTPSKGSVEYAKLSQLNKVVADTIWRMELIGDIKGTSKCEKNLLKYMLSSPESLIQMCLARSDFERAFQVIKIFSLEEPYLTSEIKFSENLISLRDTLKKTIKIKAIQKVNPKISITTLNVCVDKTIEIFFKKNSIVTNPKIDTTVDKLSQKYNFFNHFNSKNEMFMNILDLAITVSQDNENSEVILQLACENNSLDANVCSNYSKFCKRLVDLYKEIGKEKNLSLGEVIVLPEYHLDLNAYTKEEEFFATFSEAYNDAMSDLTLSEPGSLNIRHLSHRTVLKLNFLCVDNSYSRVMENKYILKLYNYLKAFSRVLYIEQDTSDIVSRGKNSSYFDLLVFNRSELMGKLLFERNLDPSEFEKYFEKLKLDYLYHVVGNCFPTINLHIEENVAKDELYPENNLYVPNKSIITYIQKRNWLLAYVLNKMYMVEGVSIDISEIRVRVFMNYLGLRKVQILQRVYNDNTIITALQNEISIQKVSDFINDRILLHERSMNLHLSHNSSDSLEAAEELGEDTLGYINWKDVYDLVACIPEDQCRKNRVCLSMTDMVLVSLIQDGVEPDYYRYVLFIGNRDMRISMILDHIKEWPGDFCLDCIKSEITRFDGMQDGRIVELKIWLLHITLCETLKYKLDVTSWYAAYKMCENYKENVISKLLEFADINLLLDFNDLHTPNEELLELVNEHYLVKIFDQSTSFDRVKVLLDLLPFKHSIRICYNAIKILRDLKYLNFIVEYLLNNVSDESLRNVQISLKMLSIFSPIEQDQLLCLLYEPLSIIEILIMNTKLDKLASVLNIIKLEISQTELDTEVISIKQIDELLRTYGEKTLDFRIITQPNPRLLRTPEFKLMQSLDSLNLGPYNKNFVMPDEVPIKDDWIPNNEVLECMCCQKIVFSMFNRRHHCRRCGRVICYNCSLHRMLVPTYDDILVRVCLDCYKQTVGESETSELNDSLSLKSAVYDYWILTDDDAHNTIVREEFSYEHAPNVSLCLSLLKYHSKTTEYPKFLLDQCSIMLKLLQPSQEPIQEIDYLLVIKMIKSLAMAAKMSSIECTLHYGTSLADRILSQADLLSLLAERGCLSLLPISNTYSQGPYIDASILRRLIDRLLQREQWNLALEVSTKAGIDNTGVFAVWGKSCLKAGSLQLAREKFQRYFDKTGHYDNISEYSFSIQSDISESLSRSKNVSRASNLSPLPESKPIKNPSLLNEIIHILEANTISIDPDIGTKNESLSGSLSSLNQSFIFSQSESAICVLNKLKNLKNIASKHYYQPVQAELKSHSTKPPIHKIFYDECVYYLRRYGSHLSLLDFYIKHGDIQVALNYIIDNNLGTEVFIEIYMKCLKDGIVATLQEKISLIDSTLDLWKGYLRHICRHLEKHNMLHSLYQLQQFMGDSVRAAMTCIRFYQENALNFTDLVKNVSFLHKAEEHLKYGVEQEQWVEVATVPNHNSSSRTGFEEKGIINPSIVMKISTKEINKHIKTIERQSEIAEFLGKCEELGRKPLQIFIEMEKPMEDNLSSATDEKPKIPTLFGSAQDKIYLAVLAIVIGKEVQDGFNIALRIIQDLSLKHVKIFCEAGKQMAKDERYSGIAELVNCIKQSCTNDEAVTDMCDEMLTLAVATFTKANVCGTKVEDLIKLIDNKTTKISAYIEVKQLKTAYFLAVKYKRMSDIRRILRQAELLNQPSIKALCQKVLQSHPHTPIHFTKE
ncbi:zinc finger FYVE domain-containing protein 26 homolog isoform X1 [Diabrotica undecimpunctata]|uniref:zinc finger FYVE domain-containing protein 26 homolog isoform X1 n=1 Tax=Diabrotica undecimpunctata TaxID=50387 RepID=UPI003B63D3EC